MMLFQTKRKILTGIIFSAFFVFSLLFFQQEANAANKIWKITKDNIEEIKTKAEAGDAYYQAILGDAYYDGNEVKIDYKEAFKWSKLAADQKHPIGLYNLASLYQSGHWVKKDSNEARELYKEAFSSLKQLAMDGNPIAQVSLSRIYEKGKGVVKPDDAEAFKWAEKAAKQGSIEAYHRLGVISSKRDGYLALEWFTKAAETGDVESQVRLAEIYGYGTLVENDLNEALKWFKKAANHGYAKAVKGVEKISYRMGLWFHYSLKESDFADNPKIEELVSKAIKSYKAGLDDMGREFFMKAVKTDALFLYNNNIWYQIYENSLPLSLAGEILLAVKFEKDDRAGFWFDYAHTANLAGQPVLALIGIKKLEEINGNMSDEKKKKEIQGIIAVLKADAYIQMGQDKDVYTVLLEYGALDETNAQNLVKHINYWATSLLKDKKKLSLSMVSPLLIVVKESKFDGEYKIPKPQAFHNIETGKLILLATPPEEPKL